jgi:hypothetical protein
MDVPIEVFLTRIDISVLKYAEDFERMDFRDTKSLRYFKDKDFEQFSAKPSIAHRRILMNDICQLQADIIQGSWKLRD